MPDKHQSYLFLHGLTVPRSVKLNDAMVLQPASGVLSPEEAIRIANSYEEAAVYLLLLPRVSCELKVVAEDGLTLAGAVWNAGWYSLLLGAVFACRVSHCVESKSAAADVTLDSALRVTHYHLHGWRHAPKEISEDECDWLERKFPTAERLLSQSGAFTNAVHCLSSYWWHPHPRPQLALLWAGIESLFELDSELSFRLSLFAAKFLEPIDRPSARVVFNQVKQLYKARSKAVHGAEIKGDSENLIADSASLLHRLIRQCIDLDTLPKGDELVL